MALPQAGRCAETLAWEASAANAIYRGCFFSGETAAPARQSGGGAAQSYPGIDALAGSECKMEAFAPLIMPFYLCPTCKSAKTVSVINH